MYYAIHDLQTGCLLETGKNATSKEEIKSDYLTLIAYDVEEEDEEAYKNMPLEELLNIGEFELLESEELF